MDKDTQQQQHQREKDDKNNQQQHQDEENDHEHEEKYDKNEQQQREEEDKEEEPGDGWGTTCSTYLASALQSQVEKIELHERVKRRCYHGSGASPLQAKFHTQHHRRTTKEEPEKTPTKFQSWMERRRNTRRKRDLEREMMIIESRIERDRQALLANESDDSSNDNRNRNRNHSDNDDETDHQLLVPSITIAPNSPKLPSTPNNNNNNNNKTTTNSQRNLLTSTQMQSLHAHLPLTLQHSHKANQWKCAYSIMRDGDSFDTFLNKVCTYAQTLLVISTTNNELFGGFVDEPWSAVTLLPHQSQEFYGGASSFLYRIVNNTHEDQDGEDDDTVVQVYPWTGSNRYFQYCNASNKTLAMGGGGDNAAFGWFLQSEFTHGSTGRCETFNNDPLVTIMDGEVCADAGTGSKEEKEDIDGSSSHEKGDGGVRTFEVLDMEVWAFVGTLADS